ncbi:hypothetical protein HNQ65_001129 [Prosthecobacter vanneervenii]|uniref:Uncharacterized protein n=1 Tax=Prosthecobacter vanneervenii TaxID=48466 RepID=A0A7W7Y8E9_9BACT|nr:hypothetical protein [Prosthecobacter vanneervenii]
MKLFTLIINYAVIQALHHLKGKVHSTINHCVCGVCNLIA